jgi:transcriptional regulator with XRE-family HTH domain
MAANIRRLMEERNKTRDDVCRDLGFAYSTFSDWYNGKKYPRIDKIEMLANYFGVSKSDLVEVYKPEGSALSYEEMQLLNNFRSLNRAGKDFILQTVGVALNTYRDEPGVSVKRDAKEA